MLHWYIRFVTIKFIPKPQIIYCLLSIYAHTSSRIYIIGSKEDMNAGSLNTIHLNAIYDYLYVADMQHFELIHLKYSSTN